MQQGTPIKYAFLIFSLVLVFLEIAMIFGAFGVMGSFGAHFSWINFRFFGALALVYPLMLVYWAYRIYRLRGFSLREAEVIVASSLLFLLILVLQFLAFDTGAIGEAIVRALKPYLGSFGLSVISLLGILVCLVVLKNEDLLAWIKRVKFAKRGISGFFVFLKHRVFLPSLHTLKSRIPEKKQIAPPLIELEDLVLPQKGEIFPITLKEIEEDIVIEEDEEIEIQEYVVPQPQKRTYASIKIIHESLIPQEESNPFAHEDLSQHKSETISSSAQILQKIRHAQSQKVQQTKEKNLKPKNPPTQMPKTLQTNPLSNLSKKDSQSPQIQSNPQDLFEEHLEPNEPELKSPKTLEQESFKQDLEDTKEELFEQKPLQKVSTDPHPLPQVKSPQNSSKEAFSSFHSSVLKVNSLAENENLLKEIDQGQLAAPKDYELPPLSLLALPPEHEEQEFDEGEMDEKIANLLSKLSVFKIEGDVIRTYSGPIITTLEFRPAPQVKVSRIQSLENDLAMALEAKSIRIQAPIPGKSVVGIEIPNAQIQTIYLREIFESEIFKNAASPLTLALGKDVVGNPFITDLKKLPHLLIAGTTGSGKSVGVNAMILSLLYRNSPEDLKLMMVDPKMVEFMPYNDLPHLITPIITDPKKAVIGLANAVKEMERRYMLMSQSRTKEIVSYNQKAQAMGGEKFPYFVIIIDELADLMMTAGKEVEYSMARIAQMGRASGIHLIVATQSPRAEVLTGLIKTNLPAHLSYKVGTKIDAGIIGCPGAETLLGRGDMLFTPPGSSGLVRLHAPWSSEEEVSEIVNFIKAQREAMYDPVFSPEEKESLGALEPTELDSESARLIEEAKQVILQDGKTSISYIQRRLGIGYNRAADIMEKLEQMGFLSAPNSKGAREILGLY